MHQPQPYGLHCIGLPLTDKDEAFISNVATRITNLKNLSGVDSIRMVYNLPDGGHVIVQDMGKNFRVISHKPPPQKAVLSDGIAKPYIPMLYSAVITKAILFDKNEGVGLKLTEQTRLRLIGYNKSKSLPNKDVELMRFRVDYHDKFLEFLPKNSGGGYSAIKRTQYDKLRATWYSGAMAQVVQIISGYGKQNVEGLPDNELERAKFQLPFEVQKAIDEELIAYRLPAYTGFPASQGSISYDYKFNQTHSIGFDSEKKPWLLQIGPTGVWAMPLPVVPATTTKAFREYIELRDDVEILAILDRFGGMPTGETFPYGAAFQAWLRAGVIVYVCDSSDFYQHIAYSSACGWSINDRGDEGYNTCYDYYDDEGLGYGLTYKLSLRLKPSKSHYGAPPPSFELDQEKFETINKYIRDLTSSIDLGTDETRAIFYKIRLTDNSELYQKALTRSGGLDVDYWHNLEMPPMAMHQGSINEVGRGYLYHPANFENQPQIKFPEPMEGGCISHNFLPLEEGRYKKEYPNSDTIMFAYYIENSIKTIKYFIDWGSFQRVEEGNFERYMYAGNWWNRTFTGSTAIQGYFYSSDIDDRDYVTPLARETIIEGRDLGYDSRPFFAFDGIGFMCGEMWRNRYYTHLTTESVSAGRTLDVAVCIPYFCRSAAIHTKKDRVASSYTEIKYKVDWVRDPNTYSFWTYDVVFANANMRIQNPKGTPYPKNGNPVWVELHHYNPNQANRFADNGNWVGGLPADYTSFIHPDNNVWEYAGGGSPPNIEQYETITPVVTKETGAIKLSIANTSFLVSEKVPDNLYFFGSPTTYGLTFYRDACQIMFGSSKYYSIQEPGLDTVRAKWGYTKLADHKTAHNFIGVIDE